MSRSRRATTIQDVARQAGVSVSTVSRVLNKKDDVAQETVNRVQAVIETLGYTSSLAARGMRSRRTHLIGLILPDVVSPYCVQVMEGVNRAISRTDYDLLIYTNGDVRKWGTAERERHYVNLLNGSITDGVIVFAAATTNFSTDGPVLIIDPNDENPAFPAIISTNHEGAMGVMRYLTGLGHRRIAHITGRLDLLSARQRMQGYRDGLTAAGIPVDENLIRVSDYSMERAIGCTRSLLALNDPPTAIFAANDMAAIGVYKAVREAGLRIPDDLSVVGFDNIREAPEVDPPLTTVDQFISEMGTLATEMVIALINGEPLDSHQRINQTRLVIRESCRPLS